ncbi:depupylase/deamidase Dop [Ornithinimicrobium sediminis]|uniref:depupylase/deamidase Dop n=1 Tax=Ornithinimicrobium sediminis TaxID=2904603 RepID=UPI0022B82029|nr:depupylase/deamidase Dop [Ornithinimicrobium sediminis]
MTVRRVMGIETEYGITRADDPAADPIHLSGLVVRAYAASAGPTRALPTGAGWDYADETPLRDARGYEMARALADLSQLTDEDDPAVANSVLSNGARLYVDHAHPEYSSPEVTSPRAAVLWDRAGEEVMVSAARALQGQEVPVRLYKNNVDGKGASYGTHDNYLVPRSVPFADLVRGLLPFLVARQVICGAGRVGVGPASQLPGYQIGARADYMETEVGLETTLKRPLVNTRDEPHASAAVHRRLHLIGGDATSADVGGLLKVGTTSLVLRLVETGRAPELALQDPVGALRVISRDTTLRTTVPLEGGGSMSGLDILEAYLQACRDALAEEVPGWTADPDTAEVLERWGGLLDTMREDPMRACGQVDWVAKLALLRGYRDRDGLAWDDPRLRLVDIQYSDVDPTRGLAARMRAAGRIESLVSTDEVHHAVASPPEDTRAWFRGECVRRYAAHVRAASWDSVVFAESGRGLRRVALPEPEQGTRAQVGDLLDRHSDAASLLGELASTGA